MIEAMDRRRVRCRDRPIAALHFLLPTGDRRSGRRSFDSKLISLLPLGDAPVHVHRFAARVPCNRKAPSASVESIEPRPPRPCEVGNRKGGEGKTDANLTIFFSTCRATRWSPGESPAPPPLPHRSHRTPPGLRCGTRQLRRRDESPRARCAAGLALGRSGKASGLRRRRADR